MFLRIFIGIFISFVLLDLPFLARVVAERYTALTINQIDKISDPRTSKWPLIETPIPTVVIVLMYLYIVLWLGPRIMANRKPFKLKEVLIVYNAAQVLFSLYMFYEHLASGWFWDYSFKCQPVDYSANEKAMRMAKLCWIYYVSKLTELADTIFFVMRKKDSQISFLHVYHHSLTPLETWFLTRFIAGGHGTLQNLINNLVHTILYFYYMVAAMGPEYQKYIWWKKHLTTIQLIQFVIVFFHAAQLMTNDCGYPKLMAYGIMIQSVIFFSLFSNFYYQSFIKPRTVKKPVENGTEKKTIKAE
ncbi:elongation of very long chain fatty acids protein 7-like isoform X2 [Anthonomus grandis grandis]|uniref:elongation of very long chain fatty acids protein 7-like isoform X2 n=1 Tax=Anthonomus grandis grandis TaxID=2921223 RepID=UPI002166A177|nr:elongation of very long chain fatty acids protein 7-like isoform X2 [Anthonomus grandis grandis]